jgi:hypothetical protein
MVDSVAGSAVESVGVSVATAGKQKQKLGSSEYSAILLLFCYTGNANKKG